MASQKRKRAQEEEEEISVGEKEEGWVWTEVKTILSKRKAVIAEQKRRHRMRCLCDQLSSLLPTTTPRMEQGKVLEEAVSFITKVKEQLSQLKNIKDRMLSSATTVMKVEECGDREILITLIQHRNADMPRHAISSFLRCLHSHSLEVNDFHIFSGELRRFMTFHVSLLQGCPLDVNKIHDTLRQLNNSVHHDISHEL